MKNTTAEISQLRTGHIAAFVMLSILFSLASPALQGAEEKSKKKDFIAVQWLKEELHIWTSPARIKKKHLLFLGGLALTTVLLIQADSAVAGEVNDYSQSHQWVSNISPKITYIGSTPFNAGLIGSFYLGGLLFKDKRAKETAGLVLKSWMHSFVLSYTLKRLIRRQRRYVSDDARSWFNKEGGTDYHSFPSGHTAAAWSVATVVAGMYKDKPAVPIICYSVATLIGFSRMTENKHWASDVLIASVLGYAIGRFVLGNRIKNTGLAVIPVFNSRQKGIQISYTF